MHGYFTALAARRAAGAVLLCGLLGGAAAAQTPDITPVAEPPAPAGSVMPDQGTAPGNGQTGAPTTEAAGPEAPGAGTPLLGRVFAAETGAILSAVRTDKVKDFEVMMARVHEALSKSTDPVRRQQAEGWKVYRAVEPGPGGSVLFVSVMSPAVKGADYALGKILLEAFPLDDVQDLFERYLAALTGSQTLLNLRLTSDFAQPVVAPSHK